MTLNLGFATMALLLLRVELFSQLFFPKTFWLKKKKKKARTKQTNKQKHKHKH